MKKLFLYLYKFFFVIICIVYACFAKKYSFWLIKCFFNWFESHYKSHTEDIKEVLPGGEDVTDNNKTLSHMKFNFLLYIYFFVVYFLIFRVVSFEMNTLYLTFYFIWDVYLFILYVTLQENVESRINWAYALPTSIRY